LSYKHILVGKFIKVEHCSEQHNHREYHYNAAHNTVDEENAACVELAAYLIYKPRESKPPQHGTSHYTHISHRHLYGAIGHKECELCEEEDEEEDDERVGQSDKESRDAVVHECALLRLVALVHVLSRVGAVAINAKEQQHNAAANLKHEAIALVAYEVHDETHAEACEQRIDNVAHASPDTCDKAVPATFVQCALYAKYSHRTHWSRSHDADKYSFEYKV